MKPLGILNELAVSDCMRHFGMLAASEARTRHAASLRNGGTGAHVLCVTMLNYCADQKETRMLLSQKSRYTHTHTYTHSLSRTHTHAHTHTHTHKHAIFQHLQCVLCLEGGAQRHPLFLGVYILMLEMLRHTATHPIAVYCSVMHTYLRCWKCCGTLRHTLL